MELQSSSIVTQSYDEVKQGIGENHITGEILMDENSVFGKGEAVDEKMAAKITGLSVRTLQARRYFGQPPKFLKLGRAVRYRVSDLEDYLDSCKVEPRYK